MRKNNISIFPILPIVSLSVNWMRPEQRQHAASTYSEMEHIIAPRDLFSTQLRREFFVVAPASLMGAVRRRRFSASWLGLNRGTPTTGGKAFQDLFFLFWTDRGCHDSCPAVGIPDKHRFCTGLPVARFVQGLNAATHDTAAANGSLWTTKLP